MQFYTYNTFVGYACIQYVKHVYYRCFTMFTHVLQV